MSKPPFFILIFGTALCMIFLLNCKKVFAQNDISESKIDNIPTVNVADSSIVDNTKKKKKGLSSAQKAVRWSLLPGAGQIYNKQHWKAPIFAGSIIGFSILAANRRGSYTSLKSEYDDLSLDPEINFDRLQVVRADRDKAQRQCRLAVGGAVAAYSFNLLDAYANALIIKDKSEHSPLKAAYYAAMLPGMGQVYNRKYWKIPIVYGGFAVGAGFMRWNLLRRNLYRDEYLARNQVGYGTPSTALGAFSDANLLQLKDAYNKDFTLSTILTGVWYLLNVLDATIDAHLYDFDISDDLTFKRSKGDFLKVKPYFGTADNGLNNGGFSLVWGF